ncbi:MAG: tRNA (5-methylaminomethyl-2-thiouridine)(34)-methyltransferase MnmD [Bacteroidia bacterium]
MQSPKLHTAVTQDGSLTLFNEDLGTHYHSVHGALQESLHIFIENGLKELTHLPLVHILEIGFGTGLNALLSFLKKGKNKNIEYTTLELYHISTKLIHKLKKSYTNEDLFESLHNSPWDIATKWQPDFTLTKRHISLTKFSSSERFDLCYFDAFDPEVQPELWTEFLFQKIYNLMSEGGLLLTYCAKGEVKRAMRKAGFSVQRLQGPPGKRHIIKAIKPNHAS